MKKIIYSLILLFAVCGAATAQKSAFYKVPIESPVGNIQYYYLVNHNNNVLVDAGSGTDLGVTNLPVVSNSDTQLWHFEKNADGTFKILNKGRTTGALTANFQWDNGASPISFTIANEIAVATTGLAYTIYNPTSNKYMGYTTMGGANKVEAATEGTVKWVFVKAPRRDLANCWYQFRSARANTFLEVGTSPATAANPNVPNSIRWTATDPFSTASHLPVQFFRVNSEGTGGSGLSLTSENDPTKKMYVSDSDIGKEYNLSSSDQTPAYTFTVTPQTSGRVALVRNFNASNWDQFDFGGSGGGPSGIYRKGIGGNAWFTFMTEIESVLKEAFDELEKVGTEFGKYPSTTTTEAFKNYIEDAVKKIATTNDNRDKRNEIIAKTAEFKNHLASQQQNNLGKSLWLNGVDQYMYIPHDPIFNFTTAQEFSVTMLVNMPQVNAYARFLAKRGSRVTADGSEDRSGYDMFTNNSTDKFYGTNFPTATGTGNYFSQWGGGTGKLNSWVHVAFTVSRSGGTTTVRMYQDGVNVKQGVNNNLYSGNTRPVYIGFIPAEVLPNVGYLKGMVDNIRFWNKALTADEVLADKTAIVTNETNNLLAAYDFENVDYATGTVPDVKGAHPGKLVNYSSNFRTKAEGNWGDAATWELSKDSKATWQAAAAAPTCAATSVSVEHNVTVNTTASANALTIETGKELTIAAGKGLTVIGTSANNGSITIESGGTLVGNIAGTATVEQLVNKPQTYYMGSPVSGATGTGVGASLEFTESTNQWTTPATPFATAGKGYGVQVGAGESAGTATLSFTGILNGAVDIDITSTATTGKRFNFLGNPYPSYLDAKAAVDNNPKVEKTIWRYFRVTKGEPYQFSSYNTETGITVGAVAIDNYIPPMQGFWVRLRSTDDPILPVASGTHQFNFTNAMGKHTVSGQPFRAPQASEKQLMRLQVTNGTEKDETVILFSEAATSDWNSSKPMNPGLNIYTVKDGENLALNSRTAIEYDVETPVGVKAASGEYTFSAIKYENFGTDKAFLLDKVTNVNVDLTSESYTVNFAEAYEGTDRFAVVFPRSGVITGLEGAETTGFFAFANNNRITVSSDAQTGMIYVFNAVGQQVAAEAISGKLTTVNTALPAGVYVVKLNNLTTKVVVK